MNIIPQLLIFINVLINSNGFRITKFPKKDYQKLMTMFTELEKGNIVIFPALIRAFCKGLWTLIIDDTTNPKYGLTHVTRKMKILTNGGYHLGFKILLFLCVTEEGCRIPIGFALWMKESPSMNDLALEGFSKIRNFYKKHLNPKEVLADGAFNVDKIIKRLKNYGWKFIMRARSDRKLDNHSVMNQIKTTYGSQIGCLRNGLKVKIFKRKNRLFMTNYLSWSTKEIAERYKLRWSIEEVFRAVKGCLRLNGCQQHTIKAQALYIFGCFITFSLMERLKDLPDLLLKVKSVYEVHKKVLFEDLKIDKVLFLRVLPSI